MESTLIDILTGSGNISSKSLKGDVIDLKSQSGNINCQGVTQGKISFQSESGVSIDINNQVIASVNTSLTYVITGHSWPQISGTLLGN